MKPNEFVETLSLKNQEIYRGDCPACGNKNTFSVKNMGDAILYNCFHADCGVKGKVKGEISKSGTPILPSKRARKIPEKIQISKEDLDELKRSSEPEILNNTEESKDSDVSLENLKEKEAQENTNIKEDTEATNS